MNLGDKIKSIRYSRNLTQEELAKMLYVNRNYLSRIETNKSVPTAEFLVHLANTFNISIDSFLEIGLDKDNNVDIKRDKIKKINQYCANLSNLELDFITNVLYVMINNTK